MSYFGHSWHAKDFFRSGSNWTYDKDGIFSDYYSPFGNRENQDLTIALEYFEKAREKANSKELAARAAFMAARCELNTYFVSKESTYNSFRNEIPIIPPEYSRYYQVLRDFYYDTEFYQDIIQECKFFAAYARN